MSAQKHKVVIERTYATDLSVLWDLWTTKDGFESWWGPGGFRVDVHEIDARVGGVLRYDMIADAPEMIEAMRKMGQPTSHPVSSRFTEVRRHERLALSSVIDFLPGVEAYESTIAVDFHATGKRATMIVTLDPMHSEQFSKMQVDGFTSQLGKLDARFGWTG
ncbi:MAG: SRPBCC domain-containing protein [Nannocystaceae bacterium]|nr:SRPBCC domain-containing protein [Nannocystaceae bacterium]